MRCLSRKLGSAAANRLISSSKTYSAEEMHELGLVHELADDGQGLDATRAFIKRSSRRHQGLVASRRAMKRSWNLELRELLPTSPRSGPTPRFGSDRRTSS